MVQADHEKSVLPVIAKTPFDILLVDLIDERFNLLENKNGSLVTFSAEYGAAAYPLSGRLLRSGGESTLPVGAKVFSGLSPRWRNLEK